MGMVGPYLNTTSTKKRIVKITKSQQEELERRWRDRNQYLKSMSMPKESFEQFMDFIHGRTKKAATSKYVPEFKKTTPSIKKSEQLHTSIKESAAIRAGRVLYPSLDDRTTGPCSSKPSPIYTGEKIIGISQMAKSNAVPVFNQEAIVDIARMRR